MNRMGLRLQLLCRFDPRVPAPGRSSPGGDSSGLAVGRSARVTGSLRPGAPDESVRCFSCTGLRTFSRRAPRIGRIAAFP